VRLRHSLGLRGTRDDGRGVRLHASEKRSAGGVFDSAGRMQLGVHARLWAVSAASVDKGDDMSVVEMIEQTWFRR
jgi:hypothetical protein